MTQAQRTTQFLCLGLVSFAFVCQAEVYYAGKTETHKQWPFLRGNIDFVLNHPLKVFHGQITTFSGGIFINPQNISEGIELSIAGKTDDIIFSEPEGAVITKANPSMPWSYYSRSYDNKGPAEEGQQALEFVGTLKVGASQFLLRVPVNCSVDFTVLRCWDQSERSFRKLSWTPPKLFFFPVADTIALKTEFVFGEKGGGEN